MIMPFKQYHFIPSILVLYIVFYVLDVINQKTKFKYWIQIPVFAIVAIVWFILFFDMSLEPIDVHYTLFEFIIYLIPMLLGGMAKEGKWIRNKKVTFALAAVTFLIYMYNSFRPFTGDLKIIKPIAGLLFTYGVSCFVLSFEEVLPRVKIIDFIATLTLECYIVQYISRDAFLSIGFPTNVIYHAVCTIAMAYCLHKLSSFIVDKVTKQGKKNNVLI